MMWKGIASILPTTAYRITALILAHPSTSGPPLTTPCSMKETATISYMIPHTKHLCAMMNALSHEAESIQIHISREALIGVPMLQEIRTSIQSNPTNRPKRFTLVASKASRSMNLEIRGYSEGLLLEMKTVDLTVKITTVTICKRIVILEISKEKEGRI